MPAEPPDAPNAVAPIAVGPTAVVVVTYDAPGDLLERCVRSVLAAGGPSLPRGDGGRSGGTTAGEVAVFVVDTGGLATERLAVAGLADRVELLDPGRNGGFAAGVNLGVRAALDRGVQYVAVLNDDVDVSPTWLDPLVAALDSDPELAAVQPILLGADGSEVIASAGVEIDRFGAGSDAARGRSLEAWRAEGPAGVSRAVEAVTGGAMVVRADAFAAVGPLDERYFLYYEDVDWCRRARRTGWRFAVVGDSSVRHVGSASTFRLGDSLRRLQERNRLWSVATFGSVAEVGRAVWLSVRRLRHEPRRVHASALRDGLAGGWRRLVDRARRRDGRVPASWDEVPPGGAAAVEAGGRCRSGPPAFLRRRVAGVNVAGFHHTDNGLGDAVRTITASLRAAGVDVVEVDNEWTDAPRRFPPRPQPQRLHDTTIAVVTAVELERFRQHHAELFTGGRRVFGYWFWELSTVPDAHRHALGLVDEVWAPTRFVRDAFADATRTSAPGTPVRLAPLRLPEVTADPTAMQRWRASFGGAHTFLVSFDYFSIPERKNPEAAVRAFRSAFADRRRSDVRLVVKSQNGAHRPAAAARLGEAVGDDDRILVLDQHLPEAEHLALLAAVDCLVSPHRSEGLGLQPAMAMGLGTAVITTAYGGVVDYCTEENSVLVGHHPVGVVDGEGVYPTGAEWADIDHDELVAALRSMAGDSVRRRRLVEAGRRTILDQPTLADFGRAYVELASTLDLRRREVSIIR